MSEISFPVKDLTRKKTQTALTFLGLTITVAATVFLILLGSGLGVEVGLLTRGGRLTGGFYNIFFQFTLILSILNLIIGPIITSFLVHLMMSDRMKDIGIMKASGCLSGSIFGYFLTELSLLIFFGTLAGIVFGVGIYYLSTFLLNFLGFSLSPVFNLPAIAVISIFFIILLHIFGVLPIRKASKANPIEAMSPLFVLGTTSIVGRSIPSHFGFTFKIAFRNLLRQKTVTSKAIICLTIVLTLSTVAIAGGMVAKETTADYANRGIGYAVMIVGSQTITDRYVSFLTRFFEDSEMEEIDYFSQEFLISETFLEKLYGLSGVLKVDSRLMLETSVQEVPGIILDPLDQTTAIVIGEQRSDDATVFGVEPEKVVNDWLIFGEQLAEGAQEAALIGDTLAVNMFENALVQSIKVFPQGQQPYNIVGICVDPLNNGKVVYIPIETIYENLSAEGTNIVLLQIDSIENPQVLAQIEAEASQEGLTVVELDSIVDRYIDFLNSLWSLIMFLPLLSLATVAISLASYMMLLVSGQQHEFGIMRAIGAKPTKVIKIVLVQALVVVFVGGIAGISLGYFVSFWFLIAEPVISPSTIAFSLAFLIAILGVLCVSSILPALKVAKKTVVEIISTEQHTYY